MKSRQTYRPSWRAVSARRFSRLAGAALLVICSSQGQAAPGPLAQVPLFLAQSVQPNIFFMLDDSGSMSWEVLFREGVDTNRWSPRTYNRYNIRFNPYHDSFSATEREYAKLTLCAGFNVMAYDPSKTYTPWRGVDIDGNAFTDQSITNARIHPFTGEARAGLSCESTSNNFSFAGSAKDIKDTTGNAGYTCDLTSEFNPGGVFYYPWNDADGDGEYDEGECPIADDNARVWVNTDLTAEQQTNFANWFSYYRKRHYVMKRAISEVIEDSRARLGLGLINQNDSVPGSGSREVGTPVASVDTFTNPDNNATETANKAQIMANLLRGRVGGSTPLRRGLARVGEYFIGSSGADRDLFGFTLGDDPNSANGFSPILKADLGGTCQQNFAVLLSDGFWNGDDPGVGNADNDGVPGGYDQASYGDAFSNTLADVAMHYYERDLNGNLANNVGEVDLDIGTDSNPQQHLVTFTVAFGVTGNIPLKKADGSDCLPGNRTDSLATQNWPSECDPTLATGWPEAVGDTSTAVDDMLHAAWNGRGLYLNAKNPEDLIASLNRAIQEITSRDSSSAAAVAVDTVDVSGGGRIFQGRFNSSDWSGELYAAVIDANGVGADVWAAHELLANRASPRVLITRNDTGGIPFAFPADYTAPAANEMTAAQVADILAADTDRSGFADEQAFGESLVAYLAGATANEGDSSGQFRARGGLLGDIIHSSPVFVGAPNPGLYPDGIEGGGVNSYYQWANVDAANRIPMVYVGANDGMLHGFRAEDGEEVFGYFPQQLFSSATGKGLHWLAEQGYSHRYYVDMTPTVADVFIDTGDGAGASWHTILVGGLRGGGRGFFALDVSDPSEFTTTAGAAANVLWEFTHDDLGYTYSEPTIVKTNGPIVDGVNTGRWAVIFGSGYEPGSASDGRAKLFIKFLDNALPSEIVIDTGVGSIVNGDCQSAASDCNGLSTPSVIDLNGDGIADRVYVGDLHGNLWVFDISNATSARWDDADQHYRLFSAQDEFGNRQPITTQPAVAFHPTERGLSTEPNVMVFIGTGQYVAEGDPSSTGVQSFYGVWDAGASVGTLGLDGVLTNSRDQLIEQTLEESLQTFGEGADAVELTVRLLSSNPVDYDTKKGWYVDFNTASSNSRERVIVNPGIFGDLVFYTTLVPAENLCGTGAGYSWLMVHDLASGGEPSFVALDVSGNSNYGAEDTVNGREVAGVKSDNIWWQPSIVKSGPGEEGTIELPTDREQNDANGGGGGGGSDNVTVDSMDVQGGSSTGTRSSWAHYQF